MTILVHQSQDPGVGRGIDGQHKWMDRQMRLDGWMDGAAVRRFMATKQGSWMVTGMGSWGRGGDKDNWS